MQRRVNRRRAARRGAGAAVDRQVQRMLESERRAATPPTRLTRAAREQLSAEQSRLARLQREHTRALAAGNTRRAAELAHRKHRVEDGVRRRQRELDAAAHGTDDQQSANRARSSSRERAAQSSSFLDAQARLPGSLRASGSAAGERRNYTELAPLIGLGRDRYVRLPAREQRMARLEIDRELASRTRSRSGVKSTAGDSGFEPQRSRPRDGGPAGKAGMPSPPLGDHARAEGAPRAEAEESTVMRDAREVAARRKRQLGIGRP
jgi:hypothetical protein